MNVLNLFDGISVGKLALERNNIKIDNYFASEIDKFAINVSKYNNPDIIHIGDVKNINLKTLPKIDLLIGDSSCISFSSIGPRTGFEGESGLIEYYFSILEWLRENNNKDILFFLENVKMKSEWRDIISNRLKVNPIEIDSGLVSAQKRLRLYWTNIPVIGLPIDRKITVEDILEYNVDNKYYLKDTRSEYNRIDYSKVDKSVYKYTPAQLGTGSKRKVVTRNNGKAYTLLSGKPNGLLTPDYKLRSFTPLESERLQTIPDNYTNILSNYQRYKVLGNSWTLDVIKWVFSFL